MIVGVPMPPTPVKIRKEGALLRALAAALSLDPGMAYQALAEKAGVSRRTLYRLAPSREALFDRLRQEAVRATSDALDRASIASGPFIDALRSLTNDFIGDCELYGFWSADAWNGEQMVPLGSGRDSELRSYRQQMTAFFERGQKEGLARNDMPATWMVLAFDALLLAAASSLRSGSVAPADLSRLVLETLLHGTVANPATAGDTQDG